MRALLSVIVATQSIFLSCAMHHAAMLRLSTHAWLMLAVLDLLSAQVGCQKNNSPMHLTCRHSHIKDSHHSVCTFPRMPSTCQSLTRFAYSTAVMAMQARLSWQGWLDQGHHGCHGWHASQAVCSRWRLLSVVAQHSFQAGYLHGRQSCDFETNEDGCMIGVAAA